MVIGSIPMDWKKSSAFWNMNVGVQPFSSMALVTSMSGLSGYGL